MKRAQVVLAQRCVAMARRVGVRSGGAVQIHVTHEDGCPYDLEPREGLDLCTCTMLHLCLDPAKRLTEFETFRPDVDGWPGE